MGKNEKHAVKLFAVSNPIKLKTYDPYISNDCPHEYRSICRRRAEGEGEMYIRFPSAGPGALV